MEKMKGIDRIALINELVQGMEYAKELRNHFSNPKTNNSCSSSSSTINDDDTHHALNYSLLEKMLSSFDKTINIANSITSNNHNNNKDSVQLNFTHSCSPKSSENSHQQHVELPPPKKR